LVVIAIIALLIGILLPALGKARQSARVMASQSNLRQMAIGNANFAANNRDKIATFDWTGFQGASGGPFGGGGAPTPEYDIGGDIIRPATDNLIAAQLQLAAILRKATGRIGTDNKIIPNFDRLPHRRYNHVFMIDQMTGQQPEPVAVSPMDVNHQDFQQYTQVADYVELPGGGSSEYIQAPGDWSQEQTVLLWAYASSYQTTAYAWSPSRPNAAGDMAVTPAPDGTLVQVRDVQALGPRSMNEVQFTSSKALYFEEFDYTAGSGPAAHYYADPEARINIQFFDSSVRRITTGTPTVSDSGNTVRVSGNEGNPGWDANAIEDMNKDADLEYASIDTRYFPDYTGDQGDPRSFPGFYRWTRGGLFGLDVGGNEIDTSSW
jgi:hypothetical protein